MSSATRSAPARATTIVGRRPIGTSPVGRVVLHAFLITVAVIWLVPIVAAFYSSFRFFETDTNINGVFSWPEALTLENTAATTVQFLPGLSTTMPLAALLLVVGGIGATAAWVFAVWTGVVKRVESQVNPDELDAQQVRIRELEEDVQRYRATVDAQLGLLPAAGESSSPNE